MNCFSFGISLRTFSYRVHLASIIATVFLLFLPFTRLPAAEARPAIPKHLQAVSKPDTTQLDVPRLTRAYQKNGRDIELDGRLDDPIWRQVDFTDHFLQREPAEGASATEQTQVAFAYDDHALYVAARMYSPHPDQIQSTLSRRDNTGNSERLIISLDTYFDRRTAYSFAVTAAGVRLDYYHPDDRIYRRDYSYNPVWTAKTNVDSLGWTAEMRIPFSQLRFNKQKQQVWGLNINRYIPDKNEDDYWVMIRRDQSGWASNFGALVGIHDVVQPQRLEFLPYVAGDAKITGDPDPQNPFVSKVNMDGRIGGNLKFGIGPNLTVDATVNPDFGQVEADPAQVNLSAYETYFDEKRPFFTEGSQLLQGGGHANYFYSRRIGAAPSYHPDADYVDIKNNTSILGATKLTGRMPSGLSVGALAALTGREHAEVYNLSADHKETVNVEPLTGYGVLRMQQEFGSNSSTAGFILTGVQRDLSRSDTLADMLNKRALTGGADWNIRFSGGKYRLQGDAGFSYISGQAAAIAEVQQSSAHYYQRPDAGYLDLDTTRTWLSGFRGRLEVSQEEGEHWRWSIGGSTESPGFDLNDVGILRSADDIDASADLTYLDNTPGSWYYKYNIGIGMRSNWNYGGTLTGQNFELEGDVEFPSFWSVYLGTSFNPRTMDDHLTRGGPLMGSPRHWNVRTHISSNRGANINGSMFANYNSNEFGGWSSRVNFSISFRAGGRWQVSFSPHFSRRFDRRQYITTIETGGREGTYNQRYIFSDIDRTTLSTRFRVNYSFTPDLSVEMYAEPFTASGNYQNPGELPEPGSYDLNRYKNNPEYAYSRSGGEYNITDRRNGAQFSVDDPDFLVRSFRSNLVFRYQWRRGSTFYLVWQQNRFADLEQNRFVKPGDLVNALGETGDNLLAVKFTYWIPYS